MTNDASKNAAAKTATDAMSKNPANEQGKQPEQSKTADKSDSTATAGKR